MLKLKGASMNVPSTHTAKSAVFPISYRAAIAFLAFATILAPTLSPTPTAVPQTSTLVTLAKIREAWFQRLRTKQLERVLKFYAPDADFLQPTGDRIARPDALRNIF